MGLGLFVGLSNKLYRNTANFAVPTWVLVNTVRDVSLNLETGKADASSRGSTFRQFLPTLRTAPLEFKIIGDTSAAEYDIFRDAWVNGTSIDMAVSESTIATSSNEYWRGIYGVFGFKRSEPLEDVDTVDVAMDLTYNTNAPAFTTAS